MSKNHAPVREYGFDQENDEEISTLRRQLLRYCEFLSGSVHDAQDLVQAALLKALPVLQGAQAHPCVPALLRRIAKNTWLDSLRRESKVQLCAPEDFSLLPLATLPEERSSMEEALQVLVQTLTPNQRAVVLLSEVFQYTARETAELLCITEGAVKAALHRARVRLESGRVRLESESADTMTNEPTGRTTGGTIRRTTPGASDDGQKEILQAYVSAFQAGDIRMLVHLCQDGTLDAVQATSTVLTFAGRDPLGQQARGGQTLGRPLQAGRIEAKGKPEGLRMKDTAFPFLLAA